MQSSCLELKEERRFLGNKDAEQLLREEELEEELREKDAGQLLRVRRDKKS